MRVIYGIGQIKKFQFKKPVLAIGIFDGLHLGHQLIIRKMVAIAKSIKGTSVVLTFYPHPNHILRHQKSFTLLVSLKHRLKLLERLKVDICIIVDFTKNFSNLTAQDFAEKFLIKTIRPKEIFVGTGFTFGKRRSGNVKLLERLGDFHGFKIREIAPFKLSGKIVSSTLIRSLIKKGKLSTARLFLGRPVSILGKVIKGKGLGRILGYPTANISILNEAAPPSGVYAVKVIFNKIKLPGMAFINSEPQNKRGIRRTVLEVHIFNFNKNIYGKGIETEFYKKIRAKKTFKRLNFLKKQIESDSIIVKKFFLR